MFFPSIPPPESFLPPIEMTEEAYRLGRNKKSIGHVTEDQRVIKLFLMLNNVLMEKANEFILNIPAIKDSDAIAFRDKIAPLLPDFIKSYKKFSSYCSDQSEQPVLMAHKNLLEKFLFISIEVINKADGCETDENAEDYNDFLVELATKALEEKPYVYGKEKLFALFE